MPFLTGAAPYASLLFLYLTASVFPIPPGIGFGTNARPYQMREKGRRSFAARKSCRGPIPTALPAHQGGDKLTAEPGNASPDLSAVRRSPPLLQITYISPR